MEQVNLFSTEAQAADCTLIGLIIYQFMASAHMASNRYNVRFTPESGLVF